MVIHTFKFEVQNSTESGTDGRTTVQKRYQIPFGLDWEAKCQCFQHGEHIENNIASDIRLSRNVVNKESKSSRRFVRICNTSSGEHNLMKFYL